MKTIFLLHGALGAKEQMQPLADLLAPRYRVEMFSFSGHGGTPFAEVFSMEHFADMLLAKIAEKVPPAEKTVVFGYSMGGYVAALAGIRAPEKFARIITLATKWHWNPAAAAKEAALADPEAIAQKVPAFAAQLAERHGADNWKTLLQRTRAMLCDIGSNPPLSIESLSGFPVPVTLFSGDRDKTVPPEETLDIFRRLPKAAMGIIPNTPHPFEKVPLALIAAHLEHVMGENET